MKLHILEPASDDLVEGYDFYERGGQGIGNYFLSCLYSDIESLKIFGGIYRRVYKNLHRSSPSTTPSRVTP
jgi:hypothetical protein